MLHLVQLDYIDGWQYPGADIVVWERELGARVIRGLSLPNPAAQGSLPDPPGLLQAFIDGCRWAAVSKLGKSGDAPLVSPWHSAVQIEDYQLHPILKALLMPRVSLLLADDVGLGKTIEAGLILSELLVRRRIRRAMVVCPASLQQQWRDELKEKFSLDFKIIDRESTFRLQREFGMDSNPWATYPHVITSMDYLRQRDVLESFRAAARRLTTDPALLPWQMLLVDEAHNLSPSVFGDDSDRCEMLRQLTLYFEHRLFLTATPHNGYTVSFTGLLEILDPVRFQQKSKLDPADHDQVNLAMVRRLKSELPKRGGADRFTKRFVDGERLKIPVKGVEKALYDALKAYRKAGLELLSGISRRERRIGEFLFTLLTKRLLSSSYAFACTWWQHVEGLDLGEQSIDEVEYSQGRAQAALNDDEEMGLREQDAVRQSGAWLSRYANRLKPQMETVSDRLVDLGWSYEAVRSGLSAHTNLPPDAKWDKLLEWIESEIGTPGRLQKNERLIIFTEYKHTLDYLMLRLKRAGYDAPAVEQLYGGASALHREKTKDAFNDPEGPIRILVATDTASEGINLHTSCRYVIHFEVPWNPMRLEQRNGRVDRHGQARDVYVFHFTSDDEADLKFLGHVVKKVEQAREDLGSVGQVIDQSIIEHFTTGEVTADDLDRRTQGVLIEAPEHEDTAGRDDGREYAHALQRLQATQMEMGLTPERVANLLTRAIELECGVLEPVDAGVYRIKSIPPAWRQLVRDTLEIQRGRLQGSLPKLVFDPSYFEQRVDGRVYYQTRPDTVLLRLGHPVMQRALSTLRRQQWEQGKLTRWTIQGAALPAGMDELLVVYAVAEVTNALRETMHQELLEWPFQVNGEDLVDLNPSLWDQIKRIDKRPLRSDVLTEWQSSISEQWDSHEREIRRIMEIRRQQMERDFADRMKQMLTAELREQQVSFDHRLKELERLSQSGILERMRNEAERQRQKLEQGILFTEIQSEEEQKLREREWDLAHSHNEQMKNLLLRERERVINKLLPKKYKLETVNLQPLAVEYIVRDLGGQS